MLSTFAAGGTGTRAAHVSDEFAIPRSEAHRDDSTVPPLPSLMLKEVAPACALKLYVLSIMGLPLLRRRAELPSSASRCPLIVVLLVPLSILRFILVVSLVS